MKNSNQDFEKRAEDILKAFAYELGEQTAAFGEALLDDNQPDPPIFVEAVSETAVPEVRPPKKRNLLRRTLILIAVLILVMGIFAVSSEGVRLKLSSLFFGEARGSTKIVDDQNLVVDVSKVELGYVPEGFEVLRDESLAEGFRNIAYGNDAGEGFLLSITKTEKYTNNIDNDRTVSEEILINDKQAYFFFDGLHNIIIWQLGDCTFDISATMEKDMLIEIAEHIIVK